MEGAGNLSERFLAKERKKRAWGVALKGKEKGLGRSPKRQRKGLGA
jgi:hypothetical protein